MPDAPLKDGPFAVSSADGCALAGSVVARSGGPPVVMAHPIGFAGRFWNPVADLLGAHFTLVIPDARGHGRSGRGEGATTIDQMAADVLTIMDALGLEQAGFVGCSMGSQVGMRLAAMSPGRLAWVVLANAPARIALPRERFDQGVAEAQAGRYAALARSMLSRWIAPDAQATRAEWFAALLQEMSETDPHGFAGAFAALRDSDRNADLAQIRAPALVIAGALDEGFSPSAAVAMAERIPAGEAAVVAGACHLSPVEAPQAFADLVLRFVASQATAVTCKAPSAAVEAVAARPPGTAGEKA